MIAAILTLAIGWQSAPPAATCLGRTPKECRVILAKYVTVLHDDFDSARLTNPEAHVNGRPLGGTRKAHLWVHLPQDYDYVRRAITLIVDTDGLVNVAKVELSKDIGEARTETEFAATGLGSIAPAFLPLNCHENQGLGLYQSFLNRVTPTIGRRRDAWVGPDGGVDSIILESREIEICGVSVSYRREFGTSSYRATSSSSGRFDDREISFTRKLETSSGWN